MAEIRAEKKIQENPIPPEEQPPEPMDTKLKEIPKPADKIMVPVQTPVATPSSPWFTMPAFTKTPPNDLYRRLLPAVLFVLTFVTVMTMLLVYMDNAAIGAQQFRLNMTRDYELARIGQASEPLVTYVRELHLAPAPQRHQLTVAEPTEQVRVLDALYGEIYNGTFVEFLPRGSRDATTQYLESARQWEGVVVRAAARDYLALRGEARTLHACLSPTDHPREVTYQETESQESLFSSRVLCLPLYTVLLAADATRATYLALGGRAALPALQRLPFHEEAVRLQAIEVKSTDPIARNKTTHFLASKNYTVAVSLQESIMYVLKDYQV